MQKSAFTYLELVIVIVVIGILATISLNRLDRDHLYEAADQVLSHIRYTQHLAMIDDRYDPNDQHWQSRQYRIQFHSTTNNNAYTIYRDMGEDITDAEYDSSDDVVVRDPLKNMLICGKTSVNGCNEKTRLSTVDLQTKYGVEVAFSNSNGGRQLMFDALGRPMYHDGTYPGPNDDDITITLKSNDGEEVDIKIQKETGFAST
ncbi:MAG: prepilin-type N-terminal cleavage/methylation domain-containing protein [Campylobacterota bacterium]